MKIRLYIIILFLFLFLPTMSSGQTKVVPMASSFYPGFSNDTEIHIENIKGSWTNRDIVGEICIESLNDGSYHVFSRSIEEDSIWDFFKINFIANFFRKDNLIFVDLMPLGAYFSDQLNFPSHTFAILKIAPNSIKVSIFDPYFVSQYLEKNSKTISALKKDNFILVTEPTSAIQRILIDMSKIPESILKTILFKRKEIAQHPR